MNRLVAVAWRLTCRVTVSYVTRILACLDLQSAITNTAVFEGNVMTSSEDIFNLNMKGKSNSIKQ
jgi:hypothetical protein